MDAVKKRDFENNELKEIELNDFELC